MRKKYKNDPAVKERKRKYINERKKNDPVFRLSFDIRNMIRISFNRSGYIKESRTYEILGCSFEEFKIYLESKFESWMTWVNKGLYNGELQYGWDIDHIEPLFPEGVERTKEDIIRLNHYTNLRPLCSYTNRVIKSNKESA